MSETTHTSSAEHPADDAPVSYKRILQLAKPHWKGLVLGTISLAIGSGIGLLYPQAAKLTIDQAFEQGHIGGYDLKTIGVALLALFFIQAFFVGMRAYLFTVIGDRIVTDLRNKLYSAIIQQDMGFFDSRRTGELTSRLSSDTQVLQSAVTVNLSMLLRYGAQAIGGLALLFYTSYKLALILMIVLPIVLGVAVGYGRYVRKLSRKVQDAIAASTSIAEESIAGVRTVRSFAREREAERRYQEATEESFQLAKKRSLLSGIFGGSMTFVGYSAIAVVLWFGSIMVTEGSITSGDLAAFVLYTIMVAFSLGALSSLYGDIMKAAGASERVFGLIDKIPDIASPTVKAVTEKPSTAEVFFNNVTFCYPTRPEINALDDVSFALKQGEKLALVGPSGSGKSTVAALLGRFYDPQQGTITFANEDLKHWELNTLRESIGVVAQEPILFSGTLRENVLYGKLDASDDEVWNALKAANAHEFVQGFPDGINTVIGERGVRLSGGQKQRIAIARAILKDPVLLILDEATSALDVESEGVVQRALERLMENRTTLIIAHRLSTIRNADRVVVLDHGKVAEVGSHQELMLQKNLYFRLVENQQLLT